MKIKKRVNQLIKKYGTRDPFQIANAMDIKIVYKPLGKSMGFCSNLYRTSIIHINENLSYAKRVFTCAHELYHALEHNNVNTAFMKANTYYSTDKMEIEANEFALELLFIYGGDQSITVHEAIEDYGIPEEMLHKNF